MFAMTLLIIYFVLFASPLSALDKVVSCRKKQWQCRDGSCISFDGKCDGIVDCVDGSDETHALCRKTQCQSNWFRCTYGACVDGTAPCNGIQECADNSDELLPKCRNETEEENGKFRCQDGSFILAEDHCDGVRDCVDGSDETVSTCGGFICHNYFFQCAYGACVDSGADCNDIQECADGSDETDDLCESKRHRDESLPLTATASRRPPIAIAPYPPSIIIPQRSPVVETPREGDCVLPPYPEHGTYITNIPDAKAGDAYDLVFLNVTCNPGYGVVGPNTAYCFKGFWPGSDQTEIPECVLMCQLNPHPSVEYRCLVSGSIEGSRACREHEPEGTIASPRCRAPIYYSPTTLTNMFCTDGSWNYIARCTPECGRMTPEGEQLVIGGRLAKRGELPWHAGIYTKTKTPYMQICGGSLISNNIVISAAHCFWRGTKELPTSNYAVAVGKRYRPWGDINEDAQKSDVKEIHIPVRFQGSSASFQNDIAVVIVIDAFEFKTYIRPVCVDFNVQFDRQQLMPGNKGKVAGWGLTAENGIASQILRVVELPYIDVKQCIAESPPGFREYITSDKICAGFKNAGTALCKGDSGGGLTFPESDKGTERYYLRGIVSTAPNNDNLCNANFYTSFTRLRDHEHFIKKYWFDV